MMLICWGCGSADTADEPAEVRATPDVPAPSEPTRRAADDPPENHPADPPADRPANRLADETSPYLRMHMHNPVDWYPWSPEAFERARREQKLIFLSVGYSSCYWCHVMERESFTDDEIAAFLNEHFVCIKVDREERPDVDAIYMLSVQLVARHGGWPMSVFMTPEGKPFFGGTYFPARDGDRPRATGFLTVIRRLHEVWQTEREVVTQTAERLTEAVQTEMLGPESADDAPLEAKLLDELTSALAAVFDDQYGGFGYSPEDPLRPKFPDASNLQFLLDRIERTGDAQCRRMLVTTLDRMAQGGIWDHVGGGFHRYSTDRYWRIPHFEKMLYDNAQLLSVYSRAYRLIGSETYRRVVASTAEFLEREMRDPGGAYFAAIDAESEQVEGKYYRWTADEVSQVLGDEHELFAEVYGLSQPPNFEERYYVLQMLRPLDEYARPRDLSAGELDERLRPLRERLLETRNERPRPLTDDKVLCSWNGQVIRGLADAGRDCQEPGYVALAAEAAEFVLGQLRSGDGRLLRTYRGGQAKLNAYLDDYAFLVDGLIALHQATGESRWLDEARRLTDQQIELFWDEQRGGFFFTANDHESLIARHKQLTDDAQPAGNSVAALNLFYLADALARPDYRQRGEQTVRIALSVMKQMPRAAPRMAVALAAALPPAEEDAESQQTGAQGPAGSGQGGDASGTRSP
jgi:uncharacterized protein YyaL (SSP411 family)